MISIPFVIAVAAGSAISAAVSGWVNHRLGYEKGNRDGFAKGEVKGHNVGWHSGHNVGYANGLRAARKD